nr:hypothetical protein GCM10025699_49360 [Microbacterium flavescens]
MGAAHPRADAQGGGQTAAGLDRDVVADHRPIGRDVRGAVQAVRVVEVLHESPPSATLMI